MYTRREQEVFATRCPGWALQSYRYSRRSRRSSSEPRTIPTRHHSSNGASSSPAHSRFPKAKRLPSGYPNILTPRLSLSSSIRAAGPLGSRYVPSFLQAIFEHLSSTAKPSAASESLDDYRKPGSSLRNNGLQQKRKYLHRTFGNSGKDG
ncbi:hypothetical protein FKP32DRAFT_834117 [Trametes sanguinea]|nr:hypothetical protein FKP32DRAFT_834117 [Trametes sanguinea]